MSELSINKHIPRKDISPLGGTNVKDVEITDKLGDTYKVTFIKSDAETPNVLDTKEGKGALADLTTLSKIGFSDIDETNITDKFAGSNAIDLVRANTGEAIGYHAYKFREIQGPNGPLKVMYTNFAVIHPDYNGRRLTELSRLPAIDIENPDIIAGSTNVPAIFVTNQNIAASKGMVMYPNGGEIPKAVVKAARDILSAILKVPHPEDAPPLVDEKLIRTRRAQNESDQNIPFFETLTPIGPHQQLLYMIVKPGINL